MENGSRDHSYEIIKALAKEYTKIKFFHLEKASYGLTVKNSLLVALGEFLVVLDVDFSDLSFLKNGFKEIDSHQLIVGSKSLKKGSDKRPLRDRLRTKALNLIIKYIFGYKGTDTHGNKILKNSLLLKKTIWSCFTKYEFFDTELLIRLANTKQYKLKELGTKIKEIRPSRYSSYRRLKLCFIDFSRLVSCFIFQNKSFSKKMIDRFEINADDYGLSEDVNKIILAQKKASSIKKISILANLLDNKSTVHLKKYTNSNSLNIHFNLLRGRPISAIKDVPSLVDDDGLFFILPVFLFKLFFFKINFSEIEKELRSQVNFLLKRKIRFNGIDSEQHLHTFFHIWPVVLKFAKKNGLKVRSKESTFFHLKKHPFKYLFLFFANFLFFDKFLKKVKNSSELYDSIIVHPGSNYD